MSRRPGTSTIVPKAGLVRGSKECLGLSGNTSLTGIYKETTILHTEREYG